MVTLSARRCPDQGHRAVTVLHTHSVCCAGKSLDIAASSTADLTPLIHCFPPMQPQRMPTPQALRRSAHRAHERCRRLRRALKTSQAKSTRA